MYGSLAASSGSRHFCASALCFWPCRIYIRASGLRSKSCGRRRRNRVRDPMSRYFTLKQAQRLIPQVERLLRDALFHKHEFQKSYDELQRTTDRIRASGGSQVNPSALISVRARRDASASTLKQLLDELEETGALIKDLNIGLIDFLCV